MRRDQATKRVLENAPALPEAPACGHTDTVTVIHVDGYGALCGACWTRWVAGGMDWPEQHGDQS